VMVMELLGPSLEEIQMCSKEGSLSLKTVLMFGEQSVIGPM